MGDITTDTTIDVTETTSKIKFGDTVKYIDGKGHDKLAIVTATKKTVAKGSSAEPLSKGYVGITVLSLSGKVYARYGIPTLDTAIKAGVDPKDPRNVVVAL